MRWRRRLRTVGDLDRVVFRYFPKAAVETLDYRNELVIYTGWGTDCPVDDIDEKTPLVDFTDETEE